MNNTPEVTLFDSREAKKELQRQVKAEQAKPAAVAQVEEAARVVATGDRLKEDFRVFLFKLWDYLNLGPPTDLQYDIARFLQHGPERSVVLGFRGVAKSWITAAFVLWNLYRNPQYNIMVVSGSAKKAGLFTSFCLQLIRGCPFLRWLEPDADQRQSATMFDVRPAEPDQNASVYALGIGSQLQGFRADLIVPDDVETTKNSLTVLMREKILDLIREFDAIIKPGGRIVYLGTPQTEGSIYNALPGRGYTIRIWPARYPTPAELKLYGNRLAPMIRRALEANPKLTGRPTDPSRFPEEDLIKRQLSWGTAGWAMQFMLITQIADANRYPLRLSDLVVMSLDDEKGPDSVVWSRDKQYAISSLPLVGKDGDYYVGPASISDTFSPWEEVIATIDPSGKGQDEAAMAVLGRLNGRAFLLKLSAWRQGYEDETLVAMANLCVRYRVSTLYIESNFGGGMFGALLRPHLDKVWKEFNKNRPKDKHLNTSIVEEAASRTQKEIRILDTMEPITQQHRLVVNTQVIEDDSLSTSRMDDGEGSRVYSLFYQLSYIQREPKCLAHDDRLDALAAGVSRWTSLFGSDPKSQESRKNEDRLEEELRRIMGEESTLHGRPAGGSQSYPRRKRHLGSGRR